MEGVLIPSLVNILKIVDHHSLNQITVDFVTGETGVLNKKIVLLKTLTFPCDKYCDLVTCDKYCECCYSYLTLTGSVGPYIPVGLVSRENMMIFTYFASLPF